MDQRIHDIVSEIRSRLSEIHKQNIQNDEIYRKANKIQKELLSELKCVEKEFEVQLLTGVEDYDFYDEQTLDIKSFHPSWEGTLERKRNQDWDSLSSTGSNPCWVTIFSNKLYFKPVPENNDNTVKVWAYQTGLIYPMDDDIPPEVPDLCDDAIILGVCKEFNRENFIEDYMMERERLRRLFHRKDSIIKVKKSYW